MTIEGLYDLLLKIDQLNRERSPSEENEDFASEW